MTCEEYHARRVALNSALFELWNDFSRCFPRCEPQQITVGQLLTWSLQSLRDDPKDCPDCRAAQRHASSDLTTAGFVYDTCARHREVKP